MLVIHQDPHNKPNAKGFQMTFENGNTISVMFGSGNYCGKIQAEYLRTANNSAEVAIWNKDGKFYEFTEDRTVEGWLNSNEVAELIQLAATTTF